MKSTEEEKVDNAIDQASANISFEGMNLTDEEKNQIKRSLQQKKSLLLSFLELYHERQNKKNDIPKQEKKR